MRSSDRARRPRRVAAFLAVELLLVLCLALLASRHGRSESERRQDASKLVQALDLTDLAIGSGTSYARHPSTADVFAPHSEQPGSFEHQPAGSIVPMHPVITARPRAKQKETR